MHHGSPDTDPVMVVLGGMPYAQGLSVSTAWEQGYFVETLANIWQLWVSSGLGTVGCYAEID